MKKCNGQKISNEKIARKRMLSICTHINPTNIEMKRELVHELSENEEWNLVLFLEKSLIEDKELNEDDLLNSLFLLDDLYKKTKPYLHSFDTETLYDQFYQLNTKNLRLLKKQVQLYKEKILFYKNNDLKRLEFEQIKYKQILESILIVTEYNDLGCLWDAVEFFSDEKNEFSNFSMALGYSLKCKSLVKNIQFKIKILEKCISLLMKPINSSVENLKMANDIGDELLLLTDYNSRSYYIKGSIKYRESDFEKALEFYELAISKNPKEILYHHEFKNLLFNIERFKKDLLLIGKVPKLLIQNDANTIWNILIKKYNLENTNLQIKN
eukprot:gene1534-12660_t